MAALFRTCMFSLTLTLALGQGCVMVSEFDATAIFNSTTKELPSPLKKIEIKGNNFQACTQECCDQDTCNVVYFHTFKGRKNSCVLYACHPTTSCGYNPQNGVTISVKGENSVSQAPAENQSESVNMETLPKAVIAPSPMVKQNETNLKSSANLNGTNATAQQSSVSIQTPGTKGTPIPTIQSQTLSLVPSVRYESSVSVVNEVAPTKSFSVGNSISEATSNASSKVQNSDVNRDSDGNQTKQLESSANHLNLQPSQTMNDVQGTRKVNVTSSMPQLTSSFDDDKSISNRHAIIPLSSTQNPLILNSLKTVSNSTSSDSALPTSSKPAVNEIKQLFDSSSSEDEYVKMYLTTIHSMSNSDTDLQTLAPSTSTSTSIEEVHQTTSLIDKKVDNAVQTTKSDHVIQPSQLERASVTSSRLVDTQVNETSPALETRRDALASSTVLDIAPTTTVPTLTTTSVLVDTPSSDTNNTMTSDPGSAMPSVLKTLLLCSLAFGCIFMLAIVGVLGKLVFDSYRKRHYSRLDYLINGMY